MTRSMKKGPYVDEKLMKKISEKKPSDVGTVKT
jgi:ribosomal protein S19